MNTTGIVKDFQILEGNLLKHPICFTYPARVAMSAWMGHVPFGMHIVDVLRPRVIGELGTHYGVSYCAFCQAVKELALDTRCYAVDTWQGDAQSGFYGPDVLADLQEHHNPRYGGFSQLIQSTFDQALDYFADHTFDLLHIDGFHTYDAVKRDFEKWLPKMTDRGVILFHDINVREREFGVWKFWDELKLRYPSFEFVHTHGLGVLAVGQNYPEELHSLFNCSEAEALRIRHFFSELGARLEAAQELHMLRPAARELPAVRQQKQELETQLQTLRLQMQNPQQLQERDSQIREKDIQLAAAAQQIEELHHKVGYRDLRIEEKGQLLEELSGRLQTTEAEMRAMRLQGEERILQLAHLGEQLGHVSQSLTEGAAEVAAVRQQLYESQSAAREKDAQLIAAAQQDSELRQKVAESDALIHGQKQQVEELAGRLRSMEEELREKRVEAEGMALQVNNLTGQLGGVVQQVKERDDTAANLAQQVQERDATVASLVQQVQERDETVASLVQQVQQRDQTVASLVQQVQERDDTVASLVQQVQQRDQTVASLVQQVQERDATVARLVQQVQERDVTVAGLEQRVQNRDARIQKSEDQLSAITKSLDDSNRRRTEREVLGRGQELLIKDTQRQLAEAQRQLKEQTIELSSLTQQLQRRNRDLQTADRRVSEHTRQLAGLFQELELRARELEDKDRQLKSTFLELHQSQQREQEKQRELMQLLEGYYATTEQFGRSGSYRLGRALTSPFRFVKRSLIGSNEEEPPGLARETSPAPVDMSVSSGSLISGVSKAEQNEDRYDENNPPEDKGARNANPPAEINAAGAVEDRQNSEVSAASEYQPRVSTALFDAEWYLQQNPSVAEAGLDPVEHYVSVGAREGRAPHPLFDAKFYLKTYPDAVIGGLSPLDHYLTEGWKKGYKPNPKFDPLFYISAHADVAEAGVEPLTHFASDGLREGRAGCKEDVYLEPFQPAFEIPHEPMVFSSPLESAVKAIAFFLPQFHPIPENDRWWGAGFTEWTNVRRGEPLFPEHYQPHVPATLGYYDLREPDVLERQAQLARDYGIYGFCFYYYWFAGKVLLDLPIRRILERGKPDFPFCICWANENWTRRWDGLESDILISQQHSPDDDLAFLRNVENILVHKNYIRVDDKPLLIIYQPALLPDARATAARWRDYFRAQGYGELFIAATQTFSDTSHASEYGFDALIQFPPHTEASPVTCLIEGLDESFEGRVYDYNQTKKCAMDEFRGLSRSQRVYPGVMPSWDNTARRRNRAGIWYNASPESYYDWLSNVIKISQRNRPHEEQFLFINAWNEWAEGCHLEPDLQYGYAWLNATRLALQSNNGSN